MNITDYTGKAYNFRSYNCWHHVAKVRHDVGLYTPDFNVASPAQINAAFDEGLKNPKGLSRQQTPENFDIVLLGFKHAGRIVWHSGVYFEGNVSHCERGAKQVKFEPLSDLKNTYSEVEFWR